MPTCHACQSSYQISSEDLEFYSRISPDFAGVQVPIPPPTHCPECRLQRRLAYRNEYSYYSRSCSSCKKSIVSTFSSDAQCPVYCYKCWWSDSWDPLSFGRAYDPSRSFIEQFVELRSQVPQLAMMNDNGVTSENSEYCQDISSCKNCYLLTASWFDQDVYYSTQCNHVKDMVDCFITSVECELLYQCTFSQRLYSCTFLNRCFQCSHCHFSSDLRGCSECTGCVGLRQKSYCLFNIQYSPDEYSRRVGELCLHTASGQAAFKERFREFRLQFPHQAVSQTNCENCEGDGLFNCKNFTGFGMINAQDSKHIWCGDGTQHCHDLIVTGAPQWCYEGATPDNSYMTHFTAWCWKNKYLLYSDNCHSSSYLFGCVGVRRGEYCILNQRYSKEEYEALALRIAHDMQARSEWGEFFPMQCSPFAYNESRAQDIFPLSRSQAIALGLSWREEDQRNFRPPTLTLPESCQELNDSLPKEILACTNCRRNYRIQAGELSFYRRMNLPPPRHCPECRRRERFDSVPTSGKIYSRTCAKCHGALKTVYGPERPEIVYCQECYLQQIY